MTEPSDPLQSIWDGILSSKPDLIRETFDTLEPSKQSAVLAHLHRMVAEDGWHPSQQASANVALQTLEATHTKNRGN